jgi:hypothetical protein
MGFEVTILAFAAQPWHFNPASWDEDNCFATCNDIRTNAPFKCDLDRRFDWLDWSLTRLRVDSLAGWAIRGREPIVPKAQSTQGFPIRWNAPNICNGIWSLLDGIDEATLRSVIDYDKMAAAHLYKIENVDRNVLTSAVVEDFKELRAFYAGVARMGLSTLVYKD